MPPTSENDSRIDRRSVLAGAAGLAGTTLLSPGAWARRTTAPADGSPSEPAPRGRLPVPGTKEVVVGEDGTVAYVATGEGFAAVDVSDPASPEQLASVAPVEADGTAMERIYDASVAGDRLVVGGPAAGASGLRGFAVFDVSDPAAPERVALRETDYPIHNLHFDGDHVYLTANDGVDQAVTIFEPTGDPPAQVGSFTPYAYNYVPNTIHDVYVQDETLYACYWDLGTWLVDVSDPADPVPQLRVGFDREADADTTWGELPGNAHYAQPHPERPILAVGKEAFEDEDTEIDGAPGGIELWDLSDPDSPSRETIVAPPPRTDDQETGTAHNFGWRGNRLYASWYAGGVTVHEVADPAAPTRLGGWRDDRQAVFWTAKPIHDGFVGASTFAPEADDGASGAGLLTFPEPTGEDAEPARTMTPLAPADHATSFETPAETATPDDGGAATATPGEEGSPTPDGTAADGTDAATTDGAGEDAERTEATATSVPGLGQLSALAAGGLAGWRLWQNRRK